MRTLPVAWASPQASAVALGHRAPLGRALATSHLLPPLCRRRGIGAPAPSRLTTFERGEAAQQRIELRLCGSTWLAIRRHGLLLGAMSPAAAARALGGMVCLQ